MAETKLEKFTRLYPKRLENALNAVRVLGNLGAKNNYDWTDEQAQAILSSLREAVDELGAKLGQDSSPAVEAHVTILQPTTKDADSEPYLDGGAPAFVSKKPHPDHAIVCEMEKGLPQLELPLTEEDRRRGVTRKTTLGVYLDERAIKLRNEILRLEEKLKEEA